MDHHITVLPASVTDLVGCVQNELHVIEEEIERRQQKKKDDDNDGDGGGDDNDDNDDGDDEKKKSDETTPSSTIPSSTSSAAALVALEDAYDDGFLLVDLHVLHNKLRVWHRSLFAGITPYFAVKCHPDPVVVEWLARASLKLQVPLGYDCASIPELELAVAQLERLLPEMTTKATKTATDDDDDDDDDDDHISPPTTRIVYANPQRAEADLRRALELFANPQVARYDQELWMTLDGPEEAVKIRKALDAMMMTFQNNHEDEDDDEDEDNASLPLPPPPIQLILRIWVPDGHSQVPLGEKFGVHGLDGVQDLAEACCQLNLPVAGVSFHCGSGCADVETYRDALSMAQEALKVIDLVHVQHHQQQGHNDSPPQRCTILDMGGGFPGWDGIGGDLGRFSGASGVQEVDGTNESTAVTVADIAKAIRPDLAALLPNQGDDDSKDKVRGLTLLAEPGRYFVEAAAGLASRIYQKQIVGVDGDTPGRRVYRIAHGVGGVFKDVILCDESFIPQPLRVTGSNNDNSNGNDDGATLHASVVLGPSGEANDIVCRECFLPDLDIGDVLVFDRMGAYTLSIASQSGRPVIRYVLGGGGNNSGPGR